MMDDQKALQMGVGWGWGREIRFGTQTLVNYSSGEPNILKDNFKRAWVGRDQNETCVMQRCKHRVDEEGLDYCKYTSRCELPTPYRQGLVLSQLCTHEPGYFLYMIYSMKL